MGDRYPFYTGCVWDWEGAGGRHTPLPVDTRSWRPGERPPTQDVGARLGAERRVKEREPKPQRTGPQGAIRNAGSKGCEKWEVAQSRQHGHDSDPHEISLCCLEGGHLTGPPSNLAAPTRSPSLEWLWVTLAPPSTLQSGAVCLLLLLTCETLVLGAPQGRAQLSLASLRWPAAEPRPPLRLL